jgi:ketosteroid isomerase-like protein
MKRSLLILVVIAFVLGAWSCSEPAKTEPAKAAAVSAPPTAPSEDVEAVITKLEHEWTDAIVKKDASVLERLLAEDFNGTSPTAHTFPKSAAIDELKSGKYAVKSMDLDEVSVNVYGDTAVSFTSQEEKSSYDGKDISGHYHFTDVWVKKNGQWQVVASHGSRYDKPHPPAAAKKK